MLEQNSALVDFDYAYKSGFNKDTTKAIAIEDYNTTIELKPDYTAAYNSRGGTYGAKGDFDRAIKDYTKAIELNPKLVDAYYNRGNAYYEKQEFAQSITDYSKTIELETTVCRGLL